MSRPEWHLEDLWLSLRDTCPEMSIEYLPVVDSTNTELGRRLRRGHAETVLIVAQHQTAGRGRLGRSWVTQEGGALTFSLGMPMHPPTWSGLSLAVGLTLVEALDPDGLLGLGIKWPNDLWHWPKPNSATKLGGILIETLPMPDPLPGRYAIVGVGINLRTPDIETGAIPARGLDHWGEIPEPGRLLQRLAQPLVQMLIDFERTGPKVWLNRFGTRDLLWGVPVSTSQGFHGVACGVDAQGALLLDTPQGRIKVDSAEISVRPLTMPRI